MKRRLRFVLGALPLLASLAGCPVSSPSDKPDKPDSPDSAVDPDLAGVMCSRTCAACESDEVCATGSGHFAGHAAACLKRCTTTSDCAAGWRCVGLYDEGLRDRVCISLTVPPRCPGVAFDPRWHCDFPPAQCADSTTLAKPFSQPENQTCGSEYVLCPAGCEASDGGVIAPGHCR